MAALDNAHALVIGIADYQHVQALPSTVLNDAQAIAALLLDSQRCGYPKDNVQLLRDGQATAANLRAALAALAERQDIEVLFLYFSGHGGQIVSGPFAGEYLLPVDTDYTSAETIAQTAISGTAFTALLQAIHVRKAVIVFDCCYAGGMVLPKSGQAKDAGGLVFKSGLPDNYYATLSAGHGWAVLASSRSTEVSWILPGASNSLFTQHMIAGLRGAVASDDGYIRIFDLFEYVQPRVTTAQPRQHPRFKSDLEENFPIALYLGGQKGAGTSTDAEGFRYDAYISYVDQEPDTTWVWETLIPRLEATGLRLAVSGDVEEPGIDRVISIERGITQSKRTVLVLSPLFLSDQIATFEDVMAQTLSLQEDTARLLPVLIAPIDKQQLPLRLSRMNMLNFATHRQIERAFERLVTALRGPLPINYRQASRQR